MKFSTASIKYSALLCFALLLFACVDSSKQISVGESNNDAKTKASDSTAIRISAPDVDSAEPAIATVPGWNGVYLVWVEHGAGRAADVYFQKFDAEAKPVGEKVRVNPQAGQATAWRGDPPTIAVALVAGNTEIYVGWTASVKSGKASGTDLYVSVSRDDGKSFAAPARVNDDSAPASHGMHSLAIGKTGKIHVAWLDERNIKTPAHAARETGESENSTGFRYIRAHHTPTPEIKQPAHEQAEPNSEIFYAVSGDGGKTFSPNKKISSDVCPCCKTSLLVETDDKIYVSWRQVLAGDFRHIAVASTSDGGKNFSQPVIVSDDQWQIAACPVSGAALATGDTGALKIAWFTAGAAGKPGFYTAESTDGGKSFSARTLLNEAAMPGSPILLAADKSVVWDTDGKLFRAKAGANQAGQAKEIADGATPAAAVSGGKTFIGFVRKEGDKRGVRLLVFDDFRSQG